ncbi:TonB-dependent receptor [Vibrio lentus]|nr:TonB-dependent receptor [Vibrio lentus]
MWKSKADGFPPPPPPPPTEDWDVNASYTYVDMEVTEDSNPDSEGTTPIYVPTHAANLWSNYYVYGGVFIRNSLQCRCSLHG